MYEQEQRKFEQLQEQLKGKIDGQIDMDMHGNITFRPADAKFGENISQGSKEESGI